MKRKLGFSKQIMLILISISIICTTLTGLIGYKIAKKSNEKLVLGELEGVTELTYNLIDSAVDTSIRNYLRAISEENKKIIEGYYERYQSGELTEDEAKKEVEKILLSQKVGESGYVYVVDSKGVLEIHPKLKNSDILSYDFIKKQVDMKQGYIEYMWKNPDDEVERPKALYMTYFEPWDYIISATSYKCEFINLVNISDFEENILSITLGKTGYMYVLDSKGETIIHPKQKGGNFYDSKDTQGNYFVRELIKNKNGQIIYQWKNPDEVFAREKIVIYKYYEPMDWYLCSGVYLDELYEPIFVLQRALLVAFGFILILSIVISLIYSRIIMNPIIVLTNAAENIMAGNFDVKIKNTRSDEIGKLTDIFNNMVIKLKSYMENRQETNRKLEEMNINLEQKVNKRTEQLTKNNELLAFEIVERTKVEELLMVRYKELEETKEKLEEANNQLNMLSNLDSLTGIPNRRSLDDFMNREWKKSIREKIPLSIVMIDIDFFKNYNDTYGHLEGDDCLKKVAAEIAKSLKRPADFAARYGGEEFIVVLPNTDRQGAKDVAERIRRNIEILNIPHASSKITDYITVSLGTSTFTNNDASYDRKKMEGFIKSSDDALYKAKQSGRNRVVSVKRWIGTVLEFEL